MNAREIMNAVAGKTGDIGAAFYFTPETTGRGKEFDLGGFYFYFVGRGGVLGDVEPAVVHSAFGYFHPDMVAKMWTGALEKLAGHQMSARDAAREYIACAHAPGRAHLSATAHGRFADHRPEDRRRPDPPIHAADHRRA